MSERKKDELLHDHNNDGVNRRQAMQKVEGNVTFHTAASTTAGQGRLAGAAEGSSRTTAKRFGDHGRELRSRATRAGGGGLDARVSGE